MAAIDDLIADLKRNRFAEGDGPIIADVDLLVAAFQQIQIGQGSSAGMRLLGARLYDPAVAVLKSIAALQAMTAVDTTNLRLSVTVPSHGFLRVVQFCNVTGVAGTIPAVLFGVMSGATVLGRSPNNPRMEWGIGADFVIPGLTPGPITIDAAFSVEIVAAGVSIRYGGPDNAVANDAGGGYSFQVYDPAPLA